MISSIVSLARNMGLRVIVEGIEKTSELEAVRRIGGHEGQGFLLGTPTADPGAFLAANPHLLPADPLVPA